MNNAHHTGNTLPNLAPKDLCLVSTLSKHCMSAKPRLTPCPARGWTLWAASLEILYLLIQ